MSQEFLKEQNYTAKKKCSADEIGYENIVSKPTYFNLSYILKMFFTTLQEEYGRLRIK